MKRSYFSEKLFLSLIFYYVILLETVMWGSEPVLWGSTPLVCGSEVSFVNNAVRRSVIIIKLLTSIIKLSTVEIRQHKQN